MAKVDFIRNPIAAAIRTEKDFSKALTSDVDMIFLLHANIMTVTQCIREIHGAGKKAMVHIDFAEGIGKDKYGIEYLAEQDVDGICTTRSNIVKATRELGLISLQRFFMIDSPYRLIEHRSSFSGICTPARKGPPPSRGQPRQAASGRPYPRRTACPGRRRRASPSGRRAEGSGPPPWA